MRRVALAGIGVVLLAAGCGGGTGEFERARAALPVASRIEAAQTAICGVLSVDGRLWEELGVPVAFTPGERLGPAVVPGCSDDTSAGVERPPDVPVTIVAVQGVDPALAVAIEGYPRHVYIAPGADREAVLALLVPGGP